MVDDYNARIIEEFRANGGRVGREWEGWALILVHHFGAKSGVERVTPLGCFPQDDGRYVVVASAGGSPTHPAWYRNLMAHPHVDVEVGTETIPVIAEELDDPARAELWPSLAAQAPQIDEHQAKVDRRIPVIMFTPVATSR
jgi:deazaflavin-dependent oxidoreductase (nitroreductase family)